LAYGAWLAGLVVAGSLDGHLALAFSLFGRAPAFLGGALITWLVVRRPDAPHAARDWHAAQRLIGDAALLVLIAAVGCLLRWKTTLGNASQAVPWHGYHVFQAAGCTAMLGLIVLAPTHATRWLRQPALVRLGVLSYSMYLLHVPVLMLGLGWLRRAGISDLGDGWNTHSGAAALVLFLLCVGLAECTYRLIELPFLRRKERLGGEASRPR
jgi:peptidoglycan/LPS O-acetylase OafA/YrhL